MRTFARKYLPLVVGIIFLFAGWTGTLLHHKVTHYLVSNLMVHVRNFELAWATADLATTISYTGFTPLILWGKEQPGKKSAPPERFREGLLALLHVTDTVATTSWFSEPDSAVTRFATQFIDIRRKGYDGWVSHGMDAQNFFYQQNILAWRDTVGTQERAVIIARSDTPENKFHADVFVLSYPHAMDIVFENLHLWSNTFYWRYFGVKEEVAFGVWVVDKKNGDILFSCGQSDSTLKSLQRKSNQMNSLFTPLKANLFTMNSSDYELQYGVVLAAVDSVDGKAGSYDPIDQLGGDYHLKMINIFVMVIAVLLTIGGLALVLGVILRKKK